MPLEIVTSLLKNNFALEAWLQWPSGLARALVYYECADAGCITQTKLPSLNPVPPPSSPSVTILLASSGCTLVHGVVKYIRPFDFKSSSNVSVPFAWITGPAIDPSIAELSKQAKFKLVTFPHAMMACNNNPDDMM